MAYGEELIGKYKYMEVRAITKSIRISPRKMRLVADAIRNMPVEDAFRVLTVQQQRAALTITKTLKSAIANAVNNAKMDKDNLVISSIMVNEAQALKRFHPSTRGRIHGYKKRGSHLLIVLKENPAKQDVKKDVKQDVKKDVKAAATQPVKQDDNAKVAVKTPAKQNEKKESKSFLGLRSLAKQDAKEKKEDK
jgi:large subunit ribosomal protein L22